MGYSMTTDRFRYTAVGGSEKRQRARVCRACTTTVEDPQENENVASEFPPEYAAEIRRPRAHGTPKGGEGTRRALMLKSRARTKEENEYVLRVAKRWWSSRR